MRDRNVLRRYSIVAKSLQSRSTAIFNKNECNNTNKKDSTTNRLHASETSIGRVTMFVTILLKSTIRFFSDKITRSALIRVIVRYFIHYAK